ncbi:MAG: DUF1844 domain-containing protein [Acetobacteraceae bacterium]|nr:DUF1844 domain-containing protein [Acetobacteraceae bacterium]
MGDEKDAAGPGAEAGGLPLAALDPLAMVRLFLAALMGKARQCLGALAHPGAGEGRPDVSGARLAIDAADALLQGAGGRLAAEERRAVEAALADLKLAVVRATSTPGGSGAGGGGVSG